MHTFSKTIDRRKQYNPHTPWLVGNQFEVYANDKVKAYCDSLPEAIEVMHRLCGLYSDCYIWDNINCNKVG